MTGLGSGVIRKDKDKSKDKENDRDREGGMPSLSSSSSSMNHFDEDNNSSDDPLITTSSSSSGGNGNSSGNSNNSSSSVFFVPSALAVLRQCGGQEALLHAFPTALLENNVLATDQEALLVLDYLQSHLAQATSNAITTTSTTSTSNTTTNTTTSNSHSHSHGTLTSAQHTLSMVGGAERDAVELTMALWHKDAVG